MENMPENGKTHQTISFMDYYVKKVIPVIKELDIAIKSGRRLKNKDISRILDISEEEVEEIRQRYNIKNINRQAIIKIMETGSSEICQMFQREMIEGSPFTYTKEQLAFIYGLELSTVMKACKELNISEITWQNMPSVFRAIPHAVNY